MKVCIAEKPSVAREIAEVLGATKKMNGYIEGNGYQVTWTFGHLCTLKEPNDYSENWKRWSLASLPMIPPRFGINHTKSPVNMWHTFLCQPSQRLQTLSGEAFLPEYRRCFPRRKIPIPVFHLKCDEQEILFRYKFQ